MLKSFPKILMIFFLIIFIFQLASLIFLFALPQTSQAADIKFTPQVQGLDYTFISSDTSTGNIARYVRAIYKYAIGIVGILAAVVLMIGGVLWIVAGGNATAIGEAKAWIGASLTGLVIALCSYLILATINPALVDLKTTEIKKVAPTTETTNFNASTPCGQQLPGEKLICGSYCPIAGQKCEKVLKTAGARDCMVGGDDWWLCSTLQNGGTNCCDNVSPCSSGYVCNKKIITALCTGKGTCMSKQTINGICGENKDCISDNCDTGSYRCK